jgi:hypothetical protein
VFSAITRFLIGLPFGPLLSARREVPISGTNVVTAAELNHNLSEGAIPVLICGTVAEAELLMKFVSDLFKRRLHLLKAFHFDNAPARFFSEPGDTPVRFVSKDMEDVAVVAPGARSVRDFQDIGYDIAFVE